VGETAAVVFDVEFERVGLADSFDVIILDEAAADELACLELVWVKDPPAEVDKDALEVASLVVVIEVSART
jgi:hypothetical protein